MRSRNLNFSGHYGPCIVDEIISRGDWDDWMELGAAAVKDSTARRSIRQITDNYKHDPYMQSYIAWSRILDKMENDFPLEELNQETKNARKIHADMG